jgi:hypothetical protein
VDTGETVHGSRKRRNPLGAVLEKIMREISKMMRLNRRKVKPGKSKY